MTVYLYCRSTNDCTELHLSLIFDVSLNLCYDFGKKFRVTFLIGKNGIMENEQ